MKRLERLGQSSDEKKQAQLSHQVAQDKLQLEADLLETQRQLAIKKQELEDLKSAPVLSAADIIKCSDEIEGLKAGEKAIKELKKELF